MKTEGVKEPWDVVPGQQASALYSSSSKEPFPVIAAPMAGITDKVFRRILWEMGATFCFTEMICAKALVHENRKTFQLMDIKGEEAFCGVQLFGADPYEMAEAARRAAAQGARVIDINMGCPVPKVVNNGEGAALLKNIPLAGKIVSAMVKAVEVPVTVKLRRGFDGGEEGLELAKCVESAGAAAVTVHGRDREQYYNGKADWDFIAKVKAALTVPVIGNGDIFEAADVGNMLRQTGCDGVMVARGMLGNPWLLQSIKAVLREEPEIVPNVDSRVDLAIRQLRESTKLYGPWLGVRFMRKFLGWYVKGFREAAAARHRLNQLTEVAAIENFLRELAEKNKDFL
ncbi:MAG TPA: tRNA dihydrouridine synthase DusB [Clostridiales bacterium]|nr:tRNA dihydrouridine synthase DusB [Clostridiales bacterium]